jgi:LPXTG-site transpeptidase (sortase) family protein
MKTLKTTLNALLITMTILLSSPLFYSAQAAALPDDDTPGPLTRVIDLNPGVGGSGPQFIVAKDDTIFYSANDGASGQELWMSKAPFTRATTTRVADICAGPQGSFPEELIFNGETLIFSADDCVHGRELWKSDPPYTSASMVADINEDNSSDPTQFVNIGNTIFFRAEGTGTGIELWKTSPPYNSASIVRDIWEGSQSSDAANLVSIGWTLLFIADDSSGRLLWKSEPPYDAKNTEKVTMPTPDGAYLYPDELTVVGNKLFFTAKDVVEDAIGREIWLSEPPFDEFRTRRLNEIDHTHTVNPHELFAVNDKLFFTANYNVSGDELHYTEPPYDSTHTYQVKDINKTSLVGSNPRAMFHVDDILFFMANDGVIGNELWKTSPPYDDAEPVKDITTGAGSTVIKKWLLVGKTLYFSANDTTWGFELWRSLPPYDANSTNIFINLQWSSQSSDPANLIAVGRSLLFVATDPSTGREIHILDNNLTGLPETGFAPNRLTALPAQKDADRYNDSADLTLSIPKLGVKTDVVGIPALDNGWDLTWLSKQAGYLEGSAFPSYPGNSVIAAHSYLADGNPGPFVNLGQLKKGDTIELTSWGVKSIYEVREVKQVAATDLSPLQHEKNSWMTLITCQQFSEAKGEYLYRLVVRAKRIQ